MINYKKYHRDREYQENEDLFKNIFGKRFEIAKRYVKNGRVLDVGTSNGVMLDLFKEDDWETWGVEPSKNATNARSKGHKISEDYFENAKLPKNYFDLVIMNHTLEHIKNPEKILEKINTLLKEKGVVLIDVPNAGGLASRVLKDKWPYRLPNEHVSQFTKESLEDIFKEANFKVVHFESRSGIFEFSNPVSEVWNALIHGKKRFFTEILKIPYDILVTSLNMGDSMSVVGKKN